MKKLLSLILALSMIVTMLVFVFPANAVGTGDVEAGYTPEGTAITSAEEFAAMTADGKYYLANDITIDATWNGSAVLNALDSANTAFTGTLDGNGKTITTTVPVFAHLAGTVKNLTIEGEITASAVANDSSVNHVAPLAYYASGNLTVENVVNKANVAANTLVAAGFISVVDTYSTGVVSFKNCVNNGKVSTKNTSATTGTQKYGGFVAFVTGGDVTFDNCVNNGDLNAVGGGEYIYSAGIVGQAGKTSKPYPLHTTSNVKIKNCVNNGKLSADASYCAGIAAFSYGHLEIIDCTNNGTVTNTAAAGSRAAGIFGSPTTRDGYSSVVIDGCVNNATISGSFHVAGIATYLGNGKPEDAANGYAYKLRNCENHGDIVLDGENRSTASNMRAAGIVAYAYGGSYNTIENCINTGDIFADIAHVTDSATHIGGILGYVKNAAFIFKNNINTGKITVEGMDKAKTQPSLSMLGYNNQASVSATSNNYSVTAMEGAPIFRLTGGATLEDEAKAKIVTDAQVASGELVYTLNEVAGKTIYYQDLATGKITLTAAEDGSNTVIKNADGTYSNPVKEPEVTTPEVTEPEVTTPEVTEPEVTTPEVTEPEVTTPEVTEPEVTTPEVTEPEVTTPEVTEPEVTTPTEETTVTDAPTDTEAPEVVPPTSDNGMTTAIIIAAVAVLSIACTVSFVVIKKKEN